MKDYAFDIYDALRAPVLTFSHGWSGMIPERILKIIPLARMKALCLHEEMATYVECCAYLQTRGHEAPMDYEWTDIYTHVCCTVLQEWFGEDHWDNVQAPRELSPWLKSQLNQLRRHLYDKRRKLLKEEYNKQKRQSKCPSQSTESTTPLRVVTAAPENGEPPTTQESLPKKRVS